MVSDCSAQLVLNQSTVSWAMHTMLGRLCAAILTLSVISTHVIRRDSVFRGQYMRAFGYGNATKYPPILGKFQDYAHLNLAEVMELPRCAFKDQSYSPLLNITDEQDFLQFSIVQYPRGSLISKTEIDNIAKEVASSWEYSGLRIKFSRDDEDADITVRFCDFSECYDEDQAELFDLTGVTRDKFDGPGWEILINSDQAWAGESNLARIGYGVLGLQMQLKQVLLHQFGHALGLPHSQDPVSIMSPFYLEWVNHVEPSPEDFTRLATVLGRKPRIPRGGRVARPHYILH